jgi:hypothetical protein
LTASAVLGLWIGGSSIQAHAQSLNVDWTNAQLTVVARNAPLEAVLNEIARQTGSRMIGIEHLSNPISVEFRDADLVRVVRSLLDDMDYVIALVDSSAAAADRRLVICVVPKRVAGLPGDRVRNSEAGADAQHPSPAEHLGPPDDGTDRTIGVPSPSEAEVARLNAAGFFNPGEPEGSLLDAAHAPDPGVRIRALQTLALQNRKAGSEAIKAALEDTDPFVRSEALNLLVSASPGVEQVQRLSDLLADKDPAVRFTAVMALGDQIGDEAQVQLNRALDDDDPTVREIAARLVRRNADKRP